ncbi:unnamed protein product [Rhizophagus irregularis]|nr:unnamed protein product [Rhizophagus irregularis]
MFICKKWNHGCPLLFEDCSKSKIIRCENKVDIALFFWCRKTLFPDFSIMCLIKKLTDLVVNWIRNFLIVIYAI